MRKEIEVSIKKQPITMLSGITFAQRSYWFPFYDYKDLKMDILLPFGMPEKEKRRPLFVWICGGAFMTMERSAYIPWLTAFAEEGFVVASIEYRMSNSAHMPAQLQDVKAAIRYLRAHADMYGIDKDKVAVGGESAGGMLAALTGATNEDKKYDAGEYTDESSRVGAVVNYYGPCSFDKSENKNDKFELLPDTVSAPNPLLGFDPLKEPEKAAEFDVIKRVTDKMPPVFITHGTGDTLVDEKGSEDFYKILVQKGIDTEFYIIKNAAHMGMEFYQDEMTGKVISFLKRVL